MVNSPEDLKGFISEYMKYMEEKEFRKKKYMVDSKERYNQEHYIKLTYRIDKDLVIRFKEECNKMNLSQAGVVKALIENFIEK